MKRWPRNESRLPVVSPWLTATALALLLALGSTAHSEEAPNAPDAQGPASSAATSDEDIKTIAAGTVEIIDLDFTPALNPIIGNKQIISVEAGANPKQLRVNALKTGSTSLIVSMENGKIAKKYIYNVIKGELSSKVLTIRRLLQDIEGISIESVDDKIVIDGELVVPRDLDRILQVQDAYKDVVFNLVTLSKLSREAISKRMQKEINDDPGGVNVTVRIINDTFFLFGKVDSTADRDRAETIAQTYLPEMMGSAALRENVISLGAKKFAIRNMIQVEEPPPPPAPKMVRVTYHFVEIGKEYLKSSFFKWVPLLTEGAGLQIGQSTTGGVASTSNGSFSGTITSLLPKLQSGANGGFSRILFSTVQMTEDKIKTELVRTEQIPFVGAVVNGVPVSELADTGITVKCTPEIMGDKVRLLANVTFKTAVGNGAGGRPRVINTATENQVILRSGESAALGGLISSDTSKTVDKDPESAGAGTGSPIFTLLRSKAFRASKSQFVVFITPKIIEDASEGTADIKAKILNNSTKKRRRTIQ
jgi:pilus assembly protein CpaC